MRFRLPLMSIAVAGALALPAGLAACSSTSSPSVSVSQGAAAEAAPALGAELPPADFAAALKRPGTVLLDVRTPGEFAQGHLPGARNIDVSAPDFAARISALDPSVPYAVYCHSGNRSAVAVQAMTASGFHDVFHLAGGITAWQQARGEVVEG